MNNLKEIIRPNSYNIGQLFNEVYELIPIELGSRINHVVYTPVLTSIKVIRSEVWDKVWRHSD